MKRLFVAMPYGVRKAPYGADIVLADLTFGNPNVYYELGIRHALAKKGTVLVACEGTRLPFDVLGQSVIFYDYFTAPTIRAFKAKLRQAFKNASVEDLESPAHVFLPGLVVRYYSGEQPPEAKIQELTQRTQELEVSLRDQQSQDEEERLLDKLREATTAPRVVSLQRTSPGSIQASPRVAAGRFVPAGDGRRDVRCPRKGWRGQGLVSEASGRLRETHQSAAR